MKNSQLAHIWAQQTKDSGRTGNGNFGFLGRSLYSYRTEIARFINGKVVATNRRYSVTTTGKHQNQIPRACSQYEVYYTNRSMNDIPDNWDNVAPLLFNDALKDLKTEILSVLKSRKIEYRLQQLQANISNWLRFSEKYLNNKDLKNIEKSNEHLTIKDLKILASSDCLIDALTKRFGKDLKEKLEKEREENRQKREEKKKRDAELQSLRLEYAELWRKFESVPYNMHANIKQLPIMLRAKNETVETSHGATITKDQALLLWHALQHKTDINGLRLGDFTVTKWLDGSTIQIGCHNIPLTEINNIAQQWGLI